MHSQPNRVWNNRAVRIELQRGANRRDVVGSVGKAEEATCKMRTSGTLFRLAWAMEQDRECNKLPSTPLKSGYELGLWRAITCCKEHDCCRKRYAKPESLGGFGMHFYETRAQQARKLRRFRILVHDAVRHRLAAPVARLIRQISPSYRRKLR